MVWIENPHAVVAKGSINLFGKIYEFEAAKAGLTILRSE